MCKFDGCKKTSTYNFEGNKAMYCSQHKQSGMIDIRHKKCLFDGCKINPAFNFKHENKALYCKAHKQEGMINLKDKRCINEGCKTRASYNYEGEKSRLYCSKHKKDDMIHINNKKCIFDKCKITACYNDEGKKQGIYCVSHKKDGMVNVVGKKCIYNGCKISPCYNYKCETQGIYCSSHKEEGMVDVRSSKCLNDWCYTRASNPRYKGYCLNCYVNIFPDKPALINYKTKESAVAEYVKLKFPGLTWIVDKAIKDGCSKKRPDLLVDLGYQIIIIEIDENQHGDYDCSCENKRIMELSQDLQYRPIIFIRFNPDKYESNGVKIESCWGLDGRGICSVKKTKKIEWQDRLNALSLQIDYWLKPENKTDKTIEIIHLFYS